MLDFFGLFSVDTLYVILGMAVVMAVMLVFLIINSVKIKKMKFFLHRMSFIKVLFG